MPVIYCYSIVHCHACRFLRQYEWESSPAYNFSCLAYGLPDCRHVLWCGSSAGVYDAAGYGSTLSTEKKLEGLEVLADEERLDIVAGLKKSLKAMKKIKFKPAEGIAIQSRMIQGIDKLFNDHIDMVFHGFHQMGLMVKC